MINKSCLCGQGRRRRPSGRQLGTPQTPISPLVQKCAPASHRALLCRLLSPASGFNPCVMAAAYSRVAEVAFLSNVAVPHFGVTLAGLLTVERPVLPQWHGVQRSYRAHAADRQADIQQARQPGVPGVCHLPAVLSSKQV